MTLALPDEATGRGLRLAAAGENLTVQPASACLPELAAKQQHCAVTEQDLRELFGNGAYTLTFAEAARQKHHRLLQHSHWRLIKRTSA